MRAVHRLDPSSGMLYALATMWRPVEEPWQYRVLDELPPGIDRAQLEQAQGWTVAERIDALTQLLELGEALQAGMSKGTRLPR